VSDHDKKEEDVRRKRALELIEKWLREYEESEMQIDEFSSTRLDESDKS